MLGFPPTTLTPKAFIWWGMSTAPLVKVEMAAAAVEVVGEDAA
jgi:hypothetical protein